MCSPLLTTLTRARTIPTLHISVATAAAITRARKVILDHVNECSRAIMGLKAAHNLLSPAGRLPVEILSMIMVMVAKSNYEAPVEDTRRRMEWFKLSHVCRIWRAVALSTPSLWAYIRQPPTSVISVLMSRSKPAPLSITDSYGGTTTGYWCTNYHTVPRRNVELPMMPHIIPSENPICPHNCV